MDNNSQTENHDGTIENYIDINHASFEELVQLPGITEDLANNIIDRRPFQKIDELKTVAGMAEQVYDNIKEKVELPVSTNLQKIDINRASRRELVAIPGLGKALVNRIIENRPFSSIEELTVIKGFNAALIQKIRPYLVFQTEDNIPLKLPSSTQRGKSREVIAISSRSTSPSIIELPPGAASRQEAIEDESEETYEPELLESELSDNRQLVPYHSTDEDKEELESSPGEYHEPAATKTGLSGSETFKIIGIASLISIFFSILLTLAILGLINRSLAYVPQNQYEELDQQVQKLETKIEILSQDIDSLRIRIDSLETVSGRVSTLEKENRTLHDSLSDTTTDIENLQSAYDSLSQKTADIENSVDVFDRFLEELQILLGNLLTPQP